MAGRNRPHRSSSQPFGPTNIINRTLLTSPDVHFRNLPIQPRRGPADRHSQRFRTDQRLQFAMRILRHPIRVLEPRRRNAQRGSDRQ